MALLSSLSCFLAKHIVTRCLFCGKGLGFGCSTTCAVLSFIVYWLSRILEWKGEGENNVGEVGFIDEVMVVSDDAGGEAFRSQLPMDALEGRCWRRWKRMLGVLTVCMLLDRSRNDLRVLVGRERVAVPNAGIFSVSDNVRVSLLWLVSLAQAKRKTIALYPHDKAPPASAANNHFTKNE
ncbi:uncharacterized protein HKW66_Vig0246660 [Vigna angularis]|uniref:Uncharacterized protein n=1 Tax=Phaseolus angularis TaxID=3914 RepID=A0A8T0KC07_PHAAN|nr:uncharacterized protein HKW66_Vig0246660 [Vigna angularis]